MNITESFSTERLHIRKALIEDINRLNQICGSWEDKVLLEGESFEEGYIEDCITNGDLPPAPTATIDNYYFLTIETKMVTLLAFLIYIMAIQILKQFGLVCL